MEFEFDAFDAAPPEQKEGFAVLGYLKVSSSQLVEEAKAQPFLKYLKKCVGLAQWEIYLLLACLELGANKTLVEATWTALLQSSGLQGKVHLLPVLDMSAELKIARLPPIVDGLVSRSWLDSSFAGKLNLFDRIRFHGRKGAGFLCLSPETLVELSKQLFGAIGVIAQFQMGVVSVKCYISPNLRPWFQTHSLSGNST